MSVQCSIRVRKTGETVTQFVTELKKLAEHCKFGDDLLQIMLRDRLICGINNECWQKRLLTEVNPDFKSVYGIAPKFSPTNNVKGGANEAISQDKAF